MGKMAEQFEQQDQKLALKQERSLTQALPEPGFPTGFTLRQMEGEQDIEAWVKMSMSVQ